MRGADWIDGDDDALRGRCALRGSSVQKSNHSRTRKPVNSESVRWVRLWDDMVFTA